MAVGKKTGGRQKGSKNKLKAPSLKEVVEQRVQAMTESAPTTPLECLLAVMSGNKSYTDRQIDAAKAAAPYVHARKVDHGEDKSANSTTIIIGGVTDADRIAAIQQLIGKTEKK